MSKVNQKERAATYNYLKGKYISLYYGQVPCMYKHAEYTYSITQINNCYGEFTPVTVKITHTRFNGNVVDIDVAKHTKNWTHNSFKIKPEQLSELKFIGM